MLRSVTIALAGVALFTNATTAQAAQEPRQAPGSWPHFAQVLEHFSNPGAFSAQRDLVALGSSAAPAAWAILSGRARPDDLELDSRACRELAREVISDWPAAEVIPVLLAADDEQTPFGQRLILVEFLSWTESSDAVPAIFEVLGRLDGVQLQSQRVERQLQRALATLLEDSPHRYRKLDGQVKELPNSLLAPVVKQAGRNSTAEASSFLSRIARQSPFAERLVLESLARRKATNMEWVSSEFLLIARRAIEQGDPLVRRLGVKALGALRDSESFERIVQLLEHEEGSLHRTALAALQDMSGMRRDWSPARWRQWLEGEERRYEQDAEQAHGIGSADPNTALIAIRKLATHKLFANRAVESIRRGMRHANPAVRSLACDGLRELGHPLAIGALVDRLDDANEAVRTSALSSLRTLSGRDFGEERDAWESWLQGLN